MLLVAKGPGWAVLAAGVEAAEAAEAKARGRAARAVRGWVARATAAGWARLVTTPTRTHWSLWSGAHT